MDPSEILLEPRWQKQYHRQVDRSRHRYASWRYNCDQGYRMLRYRIGQASSLSGSANVVWRLATAVACRKRLWTTLLKWPLWWLRWLRWLRWPPLVISSSSTSYSTSLFNLMTLTCNSIVDSEAWSGKESLQPRALKTKRTI